MTTKKYVDEKGSWLDPFVRAGIALPSATAGYMIGNKSSALLGKLSNNIRGVTADPFKTPLLAEDFANKNGFPTPGINYAGSYSFEHGGGRPPRINVRGFWDTDIYALHHELGHAKRYYDRTLSRCYDTTRRMSPLHGFGGALLATSDNEKIRDVAPYLSVLPGIPVVYEEAMAWKHAYDHLKHKPEWSQMPFKTKLLPLVSTSTYVAGLMGGPLLSTIIAKRIKEKMIKNKQEDSSRD